MGSQRVRHDWETSLSLYIIKLVTISLVRGNKRSTRVIFFPLKPFIFFEFCTMYTYNSFKNTFTKLLHMNMRAHTHTHTHTPPPPHLEGLWSQNSICVSNRSENLPIRVKWQLFHRTQINLNCLVPLPVKTCCTLYSYHPPDRRNVSALVPLIYNLQFSSVTDTCANIRSGIPALFTYFCRISHKSSHMRVFLLKMLGSFY